MCAKQISVPRVSCGHPVPATNHIVDLAAGTIGEAGDMRNFFEKRDEYMYTEFADEFLDLEGVVGWVREFLAHPQFAHSMPILWNALAITSTIYPLAICRHSAILFSASAIIVVAADLLLSARMIWFSVYFAHTRC